MIKKIINSTLFKNAGTYTITSIINSAIPFLLMPVLTRYMSPSDYGLVAMFAVLVGFVSPFTGLSIHGAIQRQFYERERIDLPAYIFNCILILICSSAFVFFIFFIFSEPISRLSSIPKKWLWIVVTISIAQFITLINLSLWQAQYKSRIYGAYQIAQTTINIGLSVLFVMVLGMAWKGRINAQLFSVIAFGFLSLFILYKNGWIKPELKISYIRNALNFGVPLVPHALGATLMTITDRFFITNMVGLNATGLYSVGCQIGMVIALIGYSFNQAYSPWLFERLNQNNDEIKKMIVKITYAYFIIILILAIALSLIAPWFLSFFVGKSFDGAAIYVFWSSMGFAFNGMYLMVVNYIFFTEKTYILAWITFCCAILNIIFNYIFIKLNGSIGAAQATALSFFLSFVLTWKLSTRVYKMPWFFHRT
jgi:O-antigen/teichoic acid export membrane protein